jgi:ribosome-associated toxin RatA of RatAB toxin-antitoxin module
MKGHSALVIALMLVSPLAAAGPAEAPVVSVRDGRGVYVVSAQFSVAEPVTIVRAVLTDYEQIPRFTPGVRTSRVLERSDRHARIEQEAVSRFMMFSKRVHLVLDITEETDAIRFRDRCGKSFTGYEGAWTIRERVGHTEVEYVLTATPAFEVPGFVLRRLLDRDARIMIEGLRSEMAARAMAR